MKLAVVVFCVLIAVYCVCEAQVTAGTEEMTALSQLALVVSYVLVAVFSPSLSVFLCLYLCLSVFCLSNQIRMF